MKCGAKCVLLLLDLSLYFRSSAKITHFVEQKAGTPKNGAAFASSLLVPSDVCNLDLVYNDVRRQ